MDKETLSTKLKEGISPQQIEDFTKKHTPQVFFGLAVFLAAMSSLLGIFTGSGLSAFFAALGAILAISAPQATQKKLKPFYTFILNQDKTTEMVLGGAQVLLALFLPFIYFGFLGLLSGISYHHLIKNNPVATKEKGIELEEPTNPS